MLLSIFILSAIATIIGLALGYAAERFKIHSNPVIDQINALLPQTQCGQCRYPGCRPYAEAIANGQADINQCPPGGDTTIHNLASLLAVEYKPLNSELKESKIQTVALIDEEKCIGCTLCIQACPVDAIIGAARHMHTVLNEYCTGCDLCLPPCPVDCIEMVPAKSALDAHLHPKPFNRNHATL